MVSEKDRKGSWVDLFKRHLVLLGVSYLSKEKERAVCDMRYAEVGLVNGD